MDIDTWVSLVVVLTALAGFYMAMRRDNTTLRTELRAELGSHRAELKNDIGTLRTEFRAELGSQRTELKNDIESLRTELKDEIGTLRTELKNDIGTLRTELKDEIGTLRTELKEDIAALDARVGRVEDRVTILDDRIYGLAVGLKPIIEERQTA